MPTTVESDILNASEFAEALRISRIPMYEIAESCEISRARLSAFKNGHGLLDDEDLQTLVDFFEEEGIVFYDDGSVVDETSGELEDPDSELEDDPETSAEDEDEDD